MKTVINNYIPKEIEEFVWFEDGILVQSENMPKEFNKLFQKAKQKSIAIKQQKEKLMKQYLED